MYINETEAEGKEDKELQIRNFIRCKEFKDIYDGNARYKTVKKSSKLYNTKQRKKSNGYEMWNIIRGIVLSISSNGKIDRSGDRNAGRSRSCRIQLTICRMRGYIDLEQ